MLLRRHIDELPGDARGTAGQCTHHSPFVRVLGSAQIGGGEDQPDADRKSSRDVLRRISHALDRGLVAAQDVQEPLFSILSIVEVSVLSGFFRSSGVAWLRIDPTADGGGSVLPTPRSSSANLA